MDNGEIEKVKKRYALSEDEFKEMYKQARDLIIGNCKPSKGTPSAIVTGGQPGAGKIGLVLKSKRDLSKIGEDVVIIDGDIYRGLHKNSIEIAEKYPELYSSITDKATGRITKQLLQEVIEGGYNFIFEGTMGKINIIESLKSAPKKFNIIARLIATSREESLLSIFERYILMQQNMGIGRFATIESHDVRFDNFTQIAEVLESKGIEVEVYERSKTYEEIGSPILLYKTSSRDNEYGSVEEALLEGRKRSLERCKGNIESRLQIIRKEIKELKGNNHDLMIELEKLTEILYKSINNFKCEER